MNKKSKKSDIRSSLFFFSFRQYNQYKYEIYKNPLEKSTLNCLEHYKIVNYKQYHNKIVCPIQDYDII